MLQRRLQRHSSDDYLLLLEHPHVVTLGRRGRREHVLADVEELGAPVIETDRGGEATYHGPGQLVGYPILTVPGKRGGGMADTAAYVSGLEQLLIDVTTELGLVTGRRRRTGVWVDPDGADPRKIAAIGVRLARARSMHGFALNVDNDLEWFDRIVPCGSVGMRVTSLAAEGVDVSMSEMVELVADRAGRCWAGGGAVDRAGVVHGSALSSSALPAGGSLEDGWGSDGRGADSHGRGADSHAAADGPDDGLGCGTLAERGGNGALPHADYGTGGLRRRAGEGEVSPRLLGRLAQAGVDSSDSVPYRSRKPDWVRVSLDTGSDYLRLRSTMRGLGLATVCEEAGCPNIYECWNEGTATFMILGERCTRRCAFCAVDTSRPAPPDATEPERVAEAADRMGLDYVVVTMVARDDLPDGGAGAVAETVAAVRRRLPSARVETLISDLGGDPDALGTVFEARPDVLNHNIETVARLQRAVRPSAGYARSLAVLCRAKSAGLTTKSSLIAGMGETHREVVQTLVDLNAVGADIVTIGQYLRPSAEHLPVARWWKPSAFTRWKRIGESLGIGHVEASPLTRSSYHASRAADGVRS